MRQSGQYKAAKSLIKDGRGRNDKKKFQGRPDGRGLEARPKERIVEDLRKLGVRGEEQMKMECRKRSLL